MKRLRVGILLVVLAAVSFWGLAVQHRRDARTHWRRSLHVAVVLLATGDVPDAEHWRFGLSELEGWIAAEMARYRPGLTTPVQFRLYGPLKVASAPAFEPADDEWSTRALHAWTLSRALARLDARAGVEWADVRLYVLAEGHEGTPTVEGAGAVGGEVGFVRASLHNDLSLALTATAHELFHCLGASDKYDEAGHARLPAGLVEPAAGLPQRYAEIMVGEVPLATGRGRIPRSLDEVRVGPATAAELRWR